MIEKSRDAMFILLEDYINIYPKKKKIISDFKKIYTSLNKDAANLYAEEFLTKYENNHTLIKHAKKYIDEVMPLFDLPLNIGKYI